MKNKDKKIEKKVIILMMIFSLCSCVGKTEENLKITKIGTTLIENKNPETVKEKKEDSFYYEIKVRDEGTVIYNISQRVGYSYGPSIIQNEDGSYDAWFSAPGNNSTQWDWISYRHSEDGENWTDSQIVLKPTPGSRDRCSVCDPGVIYFNGYYYLAYSSTDDVYGGGFNNSAFVARSTSPTGPFEKWNGDGWGGDPEPFIEYTGDPKGWGIGEVSFVIKDEDLYIYYSYIDLTGGCIELMKADLVDDWPATVRYKGIACSRASHDSVDVVYSEETDNFFAVSVDFRMSNTSKLILLESKDGREFSEIDIQRRGFQDYAHNIGIAKDEEGHIQSNDNILIGYAFGENWGRWSTIIQKIGIAKIYS